MKKTATLVEIGWDQTYTMIGRITCQVTGEMSDGAKVWTDEETGEQYFLGRIGGFYYFYKG